MYERDDDVLEPGMKGGSSMEPGGTITKIGRRLPLLGLAAGLPHLRQSLAHFEDELSGFCGNSEGREWAEWGLELVCSVTAVWAE